MRLILVRHGETEYNREYRVQGQKDIPLNESGKKQAGLLAQALQHEAVEAIYASPLQRAVETAEAIGRFHQVPIRKLDGLKELDAGEVPVMDGSAAPFIHLIRRAGIRDLGAPCSFIRILQPIIVAGEKQFVAVYPSAQLRITYTIQFDHPLLQNQSYSLDIDGASFVDEIAPARTFGFLEDVKALRRNGLAMGGSYDNAVVLSETGVLNGGLRYPDECVRHKILDMLGDLALMGCPLVAQVVALRAGHRLHTMMARTILASKESWERVTEPENVTSSPTLPLLLPVAPAYMPHRLCAVRFPA